MSESDEAYKEKIDAELDLIQDKLNKIVDNITVYPARYRHHVQGRKPQIKV